MDQEKGQAPRRRTERSRAPLTASPRYIVRVLRAEGWRDCGDFYTEGEARALLATLRAKHPYWRTTMVEEADPPPPPAPPPPRRAR